MAKYYSLAHSSFAVDFAAALTDYYGDGVTIDSATGQVITFTCPQIFDKPITVSVYKVYTATYALKCTYTADGNTVTVNSCTPDHNGNSANSVLGPIHLILADNFLLLQLVDTGATSFSTTVLLAKTTNGRYMCLAGKGNAGTPGACYFTDENLPRPIWFMAPQQKSVRSGKKIPTFKSYFAVATEIELNPDGSFAYIDGLYLTGEITTGGVVGLNYYLSNGIVRGSATDGIYMNNAFFVELETEA